MMKKEAQKRKKHFEIFTVLVVMATLFMSVAFANISDVTLEVTGTLKAPIQEGVFITSVSATSKTGVVSEEVKYYKGTTLSSTLELSTTTTSSLIYEISIYNSSSAKYYFTGVTYDSAAYDNSNISYELSGITPYITVIEPRETLSFNIEFKYVSDYTPSENQILNSMLAFNFNNEMIEFAIEDTKYTAPKGATWQQFIESEYNTYGFTIADNKVYTPEGKELIDKDNAKNILPTDQITTENVVYIPLPELTLDKEVIVLDLGQTETLTVTSTVESIIESLEWEVTTTDSGVTLDGTGASRTISATKTVENVIIKVSYGELITKECILYVKENYVLELTDTTEGAICDYKIYGNSVQYGIPSLDNPVEVQSVGDMVNLFNISETDIFHSYSSMEISNSDITFITSSQNSYIRIPINVEENTDYTVSFKVEHNVNSTGYFGISTTTTADTFEIKRWNWGNYNLNTENLISYSFNSGSNGIIYIKGYLNYAFTEAITFKFSDIQLEKGTTATEYVPYGKYRIPVKVTGKNLFDISKIEGTATVINNNNESLTVNSYPSNCEATLAQLCPNLKVGDTVKLSFTSEGYQSIYLYQAEKYISISGSAVITQEMLDSQVGFYTASGSTDPVEISNIQIELGTTATEYQQYKEQTYNIYLDEPLRKVGDVADYIDFSNQKIYRNVEVIDNTGTLTIDQSYQGITDNIGTNMELPEILVYKDYTKIEVLTEVAPSNMEAQILIPKITLDKTEINLEIMSGDTATETLTATVENIIGDLTWTVSEDSGITLSGEGNTRTITVSKAVENATITVSGVGVSATCTVNVTEKIATITLDKTEINLEIFDGDTATETLTAIVEGITESLTWTVSEDSGITLSGEGNTRTITVSKIVENATITVSGEGVSATCTVNVTEKSYIGCYANLDDDPEPEGIIYADLAKSKSGSWWGIEYTITNVTTGLKNYYVSAKDYVGSNGTADVISVDPTEAGEERFYVMALEDFNTGTYYSWYASAGDSLPTGMEEYPVYDFGSGEKNTEMMISKWNNSECGTQNAVEEYPDIWGEIQGLASEGWFIPSIYEWFAFASELGINEDNLTKYNINNGDYWSSSTSHKSDLRPRYISLKGGYFANTACSSNHAVRLSIKY